MTKRSKTGLMLVDNPKLLFKSFCKLKNREFTADQYKPVMESLTKKGQVHVKTRDTYFYTASIFNLIEKSSDKNYTITPICRKICEVLNDPTKKQLYQKYLKGLLLSNRTKGQIFKEFLTYTAKPKDMRELKDHFGKFPAKTLVAFSKEAGLIVIYNGLVKSTEIRSEITIEEFYSSLIGNYYEAQYESTISPKMIYVPIDLLRNMVCLDLGLESPELFDSMLKKILMDDLGVSVYLHGAPPQVDDDYLGFLFENRRYVFISIRKNKSEEVKK